MTELAYYEPPTLEPITYTAVTKHLTADISVPGSANDKYDIEALLETYGSPLFVVSEPVLRDLYRRFAKSFSDPEIDTQVAYSYKTNYLPAICSIMHEEGALAEIVSGMEYSLAGALEALHRDLPARVREDVVLLAAAPGELVDGTAREAHELRAADASRGVHSTTP